MSTANRLNEGKRNRNKDAFDKNFDDVKFPKKKGNSAKDKENRRKDFLRRTLIASWDEEEDGKIEDRDLEEIVNLAYERCGGFEY